MKRCKECGRLRERVFFSKCKECHIECSGEKEVEREYDREYKEMKREKKVKFPSVGDEGIPSLEEVMERIRNGTDTPEDWHVKRLYMMNKFELRGNSEYISRLTG